MINRDFKLNIFYYLKRLFYMREGIKYVSL